MFTTARFLLWEALVNAAGRVFPKVRHWFWSLMILILMSQYASIRILQTTSGWPTQKGRQDGSKLSCWKVAMLSHWRLQGLLIGSFRSGFGVPLNIMGCCVIFLGFFLKNCHVDVFLNVASEMLLQGHEIFRLSPLRERTCGGVGYNNFKSQKALFFEKVDLPLPKKWGFCWKSHYCKPSFLGSMLV